MKQLSKELLDIINEREKATTEFKEARNKLPKSLFETICSFLNRGGGRIFLGVKDDGTIIGVDKEAIRQMKVDFENACRNPEKINPSISLNMEELEYNDKVILYIYVYEGSTIYDSHGVIYDRGIEGDYKVKDTIQIANLGIRKSADYTESITFPYATLNDLDSNLIQRARELAQFNYKSKYKDDTEHPWIRMSDEELLRSARLYEKDLKTGQFGLTLAAILLFGKDETIMSALPHHRTDAIYRIKDLDRYDDRDDIRTNLIDSYYRLIAFCNKHLDDRFYLDGIQRKDLRNLIAREICSNLIIHREFSNPFVSKLIIEKDFIKTENANKCRRLGKINPNNYEPYPKNPKIADVFRQMGLVEELGSGVRNLMKYTKIYSGGTPKFDEEDIFTAIVPIDYKDDTINDTLTDTTNDTLKLSENNKKVLKEIKANNSITREELKIKIGLSDRTISRNIKELQNKQIIKREGSKKAGYWKILI